MTRYLGRLPVDGGVFGEDVGEFQWTLRRRRFVDDGNLDGNLDGALAVLDHNLVLTGVTAGRLHHLQIHFLNVRTGLQKRE